MPTKKKKVTRGGKKTTTTSSSSRRKNGIDISKYSKKSTLKTPRKTKEKSYSDVLKESDKKRPYGSLAKSSIVTKSSQSKTTPKKRKSSSYLSAKSSTDLYNKKGFGIGGSSHYLGKRKSKKETPRKVKASGASLRSSSDGSFFSKNKQSSFRYKRNKKTGNTKLVQKSFNQRGMTKKVYKNGKLVRSKNKKY